KALDADLAELRKLADGDDGWVAAKGLILNERPDDALKWLKDQPALREMLFDLLAAQLRYREALALAERPEGGEDGPPTLGLRQARVLYLLGEKDRAGQLFAKLAGGLKSPNDVESALALVQAEVRLGLKDA